MIKDDGSYRCDFCSDFNESGEFYTATGNHISCTELREKVKLEKENKALRAEIAELREKFIQLTELFTASCDDREDLRAALAKVLK